MPEYCVTGGTGLIAAYLIKSLLEKGHTVRTTARDPENTDKVGYLLQLNGAKERLKIMRADLVEEGSFDAAVEGADGVFHVASPVLVANDDNVKEKIDRSMHKRNPKRAKILQEIYECEEGCLNLILLFDPIQI